jgi:hypothetical protein
MSHERVGYPEKRHTMQGTAFFPCPRFLYNVILPSILRARN